MGIKVQVPANLFCPQCGKKRTGINGDDGSVRYECKPCGVSIYSKFRFPTKMRLEIKKAYN